LLAQDPSGGFAELTGQPIDVRRVDGDHFTMMESPYVSTLAAIINDALP